MAVFKANSVISNKKGRFPLLIIFLSIYQRALFSPILPTRHQFSTSCAAQSLGVLPNYDKLKENMQNHAASGYLGNALQDLDMMRFVPSKPTVYDYNSLFYCYLKSEHESFDEVVEIYKGMKRCGPTPNALTYKTLLNGMSSEGSLKHGIYIAEEMCASGFMPSFTCLSKLLKRLIGIGYLIDSLHLLKLMLRLNYIPTEPALNMLIVDLSKVGMVREAFFALCVLLDKTQVGGAYVFNPIMWALAKLHGSASALACFFCFVKKKGLVPDVRSYTALIYGYCREGLWGDAFHCLNQMEFDGCKPSTITFTVLVKFLCDDGEVVEALKLLEHMEKRGCEPDLVTYNIVMRKFGLQGRALEMVELFKVINNKGLSPDPYTHSAYAGGMLKQGKTETAKEYLHDIILRRCSVDDVVYNIYFHALCLEKKSKEALSWMISFKGSGFRPTNVTYNTILKGLCMEKNISKAMAFFKCTEWSRDGPDLISFNTILSAACKSQNYALIYQIFRQVETKGFKHDIFSYTPFVQYYGFVGDISESLKLFESLMTSGPSPTVVTLNVLLKALCRSKMIETAERILERSPVSPNMTTFNILLCALVREGKYLSVHKLLGSVNTHRLRYDIVTCRCLVTGFCYGGNVTSALQLRNVMLVNGIFPDITIYNVILEAMLMKKQISEIILLLKEMAQEGCELNFVTHQIMKSAVLKAQNGGSPREAKLLRHIMHSKKWSVKGISQR